MRRVDDLNIWMSQFEFTKVQWYGLQNEEYDKDDALCPITNVSYGEVYLLLTKLGEMTGLFFALPSVEEWQIVARGGNNCEGMRYAGDDNVDLVAWYKDNSKGTIRPSDGQQGMSPNGLDMYDMSGNVGELCNTPFDGNPAAYTVCGGNFNSPKEDVTVDSRVAFSIDAKDETVGFRVIIRPNFN
jgi:formylglycine-generating enzyme required for sulfatase activity